MPCWLALSRRLPYSVRLNAVNRCCDRGKVRTAALPTLPVSRIGRLIKAAGLADAVQRSKNSGIAAFALLVDAKGEQAARFYRHHGFIRKWGQSQLSIAL